MCCGNRQKRRGLTATGVQFSTQKIEQTGQQRTIQSQTAVGTQSFETPVTAMQPTIPVENPPPYVEEKEVALQRDSKHFDGEKIVRTKSGTTDRNVYAINKQEHPIVDAQAVGESSCSAFNMPIRRERIVIADKDHVVTKNGGKQRRRTCLSRWLWDASQG